MVIYTLTVALASPYTFIEHVRMPGYANRMQLLIALFIACEFGCYVMIRQVVNAKEWLSAWRGRKGLLRKRLRASRSYQEWKDAAEVLDDFLYFDEWKRTDEDPFYDWRLIRKVGVIVVTLIAVTRMWRV